MKNYFTKTKAQVWFSVWKTVSLFVLLSFMGMQSANAQYTAIPDANFEQALFDLGIDTVNGDHQVLTSNVSGVTTLVVSFKNITVLTGIQSFISLTSLDCSNNFSLNSLNVSANTALTYLYCNGNSLTSLNLSANTALTYLYCYGNSLTSLNLSTNTSLISLDCGNNSLTSLNVSGLSNLAYLFCNQNTISSLNISGCSALTSLNCQWNSISNLDVSGHAALTSLNCYSNAMVNLNASACVNLASISCSYNSLNSINLLNCTALNYLDCNTNLLANLDVSTNLVLDHLDCSSNHLTSLNLYNNSSLTYLACAVNSLSNLNVNHNLLLTELYCGANLLSSLDVNSNVVLSKLNCQSNSLTYLTVSSNLALTTLNCDFNFLSNLNVSANTALTNLTCSENKLLGLNLSSNSVLSELQCDFNAPFLTCITVANVVAANANSSWIKDATASYSTNCGGGVATSKIQSAQANSTLSSINLPVFADWVQGVTDYRFKVVHGTTTPTTEIIERGINRYFYLTSLASGAVYNRIYTVSVSTKYNGVWGIYGTECTITSPAAPLTKVQTSQCNSVMATVNSPIFANWVQFATDYRFKVVYNGTIPTTEIIERGINRYFYLTSLASGAVYNRSYTVSVATKCNGTWGSYGDPCTVTSPMVPATKVQTSQCGIPLATINSPIFADWVPYVTNYSFKVVYTGTTTTTEYFDRGINRYFYLTYLASGAVYNRSYTVSVATKSNGVWGEYGTVCTVTTPSNMTRLLQQSKAIEANEVSVKVYPNPFATNFKLDFSSSSESNVEVVIYDMIGRQLEKLQVISSEMNNLEIGNNYPSGVYNVIVRQGEEVRTLRVIKR